MKTGTQSAFVISWSQTTIDGKPAAPVASLCVGACWRWAGEPLRIARPSELVALERASGETDRRRRTALGIQKLVWAAIDPSRPFGAHRVESADLNMGFEVTDGHSSYIISVVDGADDQVLLVFDGDGPPADACLWVVRASMCPDHENRLSEQPVGMIRLPQGTRLRTPEGEACIENLQEGDNVLTRDNGVQKILWSGRRCMSFAELSAIPRSRPIRLRGGALRPGQPDADLVVSGNHQILLNGKRAREAFGEDEVLISALDLLDESRVVMDRDQGDLTEHFILLAMHEVVWANAVQVESFHPVNSGLETLDARQLGQLFRKYPYLAYDAMAFAPFLGQDVAENDAAVFVKQMA